MLKGTFYLLGTVLLIFVVVWIVQGADFFLYRYFVPKYENVRRETFEQSHAYVRGTVQDLYALQVDYIKGDDVQKEALRTIILHRAAGFDENNLPVDLKQFIDGLKKGNVK